MEMIWPDLLFEETVAWYCKNLKRSIFIWQTRHDLRHKWKGHIYWSQPTFRCEWLSIMLYIMTPGRVMKITFLGKLGCISNVFSLASKKKRRQELYNGTSLGPYGNVSEEQNEYSRMLGLYQAMPITSFSFDKWIFHFNVILEEMTGHHLAIQIIA